MKQLTLDENMVQELLLELGEIPSKYSMNLILKIQATFKEQNKEEEPEETEGETLTVVK